MCQIHVSYKLNVMGIGFYYYKIKKEENKMSSDFIPMSVFNIVSENFTQND